jgi:hypothetical protein
MVRVSKAAWVWLIILVVNIPLGIGVFFFVKSQMASMSAAAERKQAELVARAEQAERERAEAEARAGEQTEPEEDEETPEKPVVRPPADTGDDNKNNEEEPEEPTPPADELALTITCNNAGCEELASQTSAVIVRISSDVELHVPVGWTNDGDNTIRRRFSAPTKTDADAQPLAPVEVEIKSQDGRAKKVVFPIDSWFNNAYTNNN